MYDATNLYIFVEVKDPNNVNDGGNWWDNDGVEVFIDGNNSKGTTYDAVDDYQFWCRKKWSKKFWNKYWYKTCKHCYSSNLKCSSEAEDRALQTVLFEVRMAFLELTSMINLQAMQPPQPPPPGKR